MATPYVTIVIAEANSTQDLAAAELAKSDRPVLIVASKQTTGRGRSGNEWWQAPRAVSASLAFSNDTLLVGETFPLAVGLAVRDALAEISTTAVSLKWPNDLEGPDGKVGGILVEHDDERTVVGCGINLWWPGPPRGVGAIFESDPGDDVGAHVARAWVDAVLASQGTWDRESYVAACSTLGTELTWDPDGRGKAIDVDKRGGLVVSTANGITTLRSGEVRAVRRA